MRQAPIYTTINRLKLFLNLNSKLSRMFSRLNSSGYSNEPIMSIAYQGIQIKLEGVTHVQPNKITVPLGLAVVLQLQKEINTEIREQRLCTTLLVSS